MVWFAFNPGFGTIDEFLNIERWFGVKDPVELTLRYDRALEMLATEDLETWVRHSTEAGVSEESLDHFRRDWLRGDAIAADGDHIVGALHDGFTAALTDAREHEMRTSIIWMQHGDEFAVNHVVGGNGVTVVISVPEGTVPENAQSTS